MLSVIVQTKGVEGACTNFEIMDASSTASTVPHAATCHGMQSVIALPGLAKVVNAGFNEGNLKWRRCRATRR